MKDGGVDFMLYVHFDARSTESVVINVKALQLVTDFETYNITYYIT